MKFKKAGDFFVKAISTVFFIGYLPLVPGTFGSIAGVGLFYLLRGTTLINYFLFIFGIVILGLMTGGRMEKLLNKKDPGCIVIDEVAGMLIALSFIPYDFKLIFLAFLVFRVLDTLKPYPAGKLQHLSGSAGILTDDLIAGIYTNIVVLIILKLAVFFKFHKLADNKRIAFKAEFFRIFSRLPENLNLWQMSLFFSDRQIKTVPTDMAVVVLPGLAIPVMLMPKLVWVFFRMFLAINIATWRETAPYLAIIFAGIFRIISLDLLL